MPPVAPVTSAVLPVRSNITPSLSRLFGDSPARRLEGGHIVGCSDGDAARSLGDALDEAGEHLAGTDLVEPGDALSRHEGDRLAPAHRAGHLRNERAHDLTWI